MTAPLRSFAPELLSRLEAYGSYSYHQPSLLARWIGIPAAVEWESPAGFENDLAPVAVTLWFSAGKGGEEELTRLLDALDAFRRDLPEHFTALRSLVVDCFRDCYERDLPVAERQRLAGESESISDGVILRTVRAAHFRFDATGKAIVRTAWMEIDWTGEHGLDVEWNAGGGLLRPWRD
ncbi:MAG TPA: hypothetical protein VMP01_27030 [Pirellulaceae bacterium]|nr:hypothetical protein [Pirellulaceae bacterium]